MVNVIINHISSVLQGRSDRAVLVGRSSFGNDLITYASAEAERGGIRGSEEADIAVGAKLALVARFL